MMTFNITLLTLLIICIIILFIYVKKFKNAKNILSSEYDNLLNRKGFYDGTYNLKDDVRNKTDVYKYRIVVEELEKFNNGYSKLKILNITVNGYCLSKYDTIKKYCNNDFSEIKETSSITWLESNKDIIEVRKRKLERVLQS